MDADWLFVTTSPNCAKHQSLPPSDMRDLANSFLTFQQAQENLSAVRNAQAQKLLYDLAKRWESDIDTFASILRDKAKSVFGLSSVAFTLIFAGAGYIAGANNSIPGIVLTIESLVLLLVASHLARALLTAITVLTAEEVVRPSMQDYVRILSMAPEQQENLGHMYLTLSAQTVSAANQRHRRMLPRINDMIGAKAAFRWGIIYMVLLIAIHLSGTLVWPPKKESTGKEEISTSQQAASATTSLVPAEPLRALTYVDAGLDGGPNGVAATDDSATDLANYSIEGGVLDAGRLTDEGASSQQPNYSIESGVLDAGRLTDGGNSSQQP